MSGGYKDDVDEGETIEYTGEGGQNKGRLQVNNQLLKPRKGGGNLGLAMNWAGDIPVRVLRKVDGGEARQEHYVYDGK